MFSMRLEEIKKSLDSNKTSLESKIETENIENTQDFLSLMCEVMEDEKICKFVVEGFGKSPWPVDVSTDLLSILEQIPDFLEFLCSDSSIKEYLDFYEQGIEKRLIFEKNNSSINIACESLSSNSTVNALNIDWGNNPKEDSLEQDKLRNMICKLVTTFISLIHKYFPELTSHQFFIQWRDNKYVLACLND